MEKVRDSFRMMRRAAVTQLLAVMTATAWAQYSSYNINFNANYEGKEDFWVNIPVSYDWIEGDYNYTISNTYLETQFGRGDDWTIIGWATSADGPKVYEANEKITLTENQTDLYAKWVHKCTVTFDANGGSGTMNAIRHEVGSKYTIPSCSFTRSDYDFIGWATSADGAVAYLPDESITLTADLTLYAKWITVGDNAIVGDFRYQVNSVSPAEVMLLYFFIKPTGALSIPASVRIGCAVYSVTVIGGSALAHCSDLTSVIIPNSVSSIESAAFSSCSGLITVTIGNNVTLIGGDVFKGCTSVTDVYCYADPSALNWSDYNCDDFKSGKATRCHVAADKLATFNSKWNTGSSYDVNVTFVGDLDDLTASLSDGDDISALGLPSGVICDVTLTRTFPAGKKQTVCLPFEPTELLNHGKVWQFSGISGGKAVMTEVTTGTLQPNTPYIFEATSEVTSITFNNVAVNIDADPKTVDATEGFTFHGTYTQKIWEADDAAVTGGTLYGFMMKENDGQAVGQFVKARKRTSLRPFSCWLEYNGDLTGTEASPAPQRAGNRAEAVSLPDVIEIVWIGSSDIPGTTGMMDTRTGEIYEDDAWYSIYGTKLDGRPAKTGLYINNGKKVYISVE